MLVSLCRMSAVEDSALRALREQFFAHRSDLIEAFKECDPDGTGKENGHFSSEIQPVGGPYI